MENAEAGPSRPRPVVVVAAGPLPTPLAPATPTSKKEKRRSWFGLSSPSVTTPKKADRENERERKTSVVDISEELELPPVLKSERTSAAVSRSGGEASTDESRERGEEVLTIDGTPDPDRTIKKKKKRWSHDADNDFEVLRMEELDGKGKIAEGERLASRSVFDRTAMDQQGDGQRMPHAPSLRTRTFSRTASDRDTFRPDPPIPPPPPDFTPHSPTSTSSAPHHITIKPRTSSMTSNLSPTSAAFSEKSQPPIPVDVDRPLPPLPSFNSFGIPTPPHEIVVTPSSPAKLTKSKTPKRFPNSERRSRSATGRPRDSSPAKRSRSTAPASKIGLGLPSALLPSSRTQSAEDLAPPPVPSKPQSVSSPLPSRSGSPIPKIAFVEPEQPATDRSKDSDTEKRSRVKRARSLSGIFGKTPPLVQADKLPTPDSVDSQDVESLGKSQGVLEWLGVKRTIKRRQSEAKLKEQGFESVPTLDQLPDVEQGRSRESLISVHAIEAGNLSDTLQTPRRPDLRSGSSTVTIVPQNSTPGRLASLFNRRTSAKDPEEGPEHPPTISAAPRPIPNAGLRGLTASSETSFILPAVDPLSPIAPDNGHWVSSPGTEGEETLFSPGGSSHWGPGVRPWMDATDGHNSSRSSTSSPLGPLPEQELSAPVHKEPLKSPAIAREGRLRSWSDAPLPPHRALGNATGPQSSGRRPSSPGIQAGSQSLQPSPQTPGRPGLGSRSNSGNSAIIGRMRSVFSKTTSRSRSNSLLRQASSDADEFGNITSQRMRPSTSSSSIASSVLARGRSPGDDRPPNSIALGLEERSPRTSFTPSMSSLASRGSARNSVVPDQTLEIAQKAARKSRARASTMSLAPTAHHFTPPSPGLFPNLATPPRRRPGTITRLSNGLFGSGPSSPRSASLFPLPPRSSGSISSVTTTGNGMSGHNWEESSTGAFSPGTSPRPSSGSISAAMTSSAVKQAARREGDEKPSRWLERVVNTVGRHEIANVLAASGDEFHTEALETYLATFDFTHNALDVALRRLLMHMSLPKETQQIDRVIEAFSKRYEYCEPGLFGGKDNTYVLAFSMMILHTDAFNKHNKNKMTKADYVRNTRMNGVPPLVLEAFFDNITFTPFVFIEDDSDLKRSSGYETASSSLFGPSTPTFSGPLNAPNPSLSKSSKVDVYHMIVRGLLGTLRVDVERLVPADNPFSCLGTRPFLDCDGLSRAFASAHSLLIPSPTLQSQKKMTGKMAPATKRGGSEGTAEAEMILRVTKVGLLSRKDDGGESSKKPNRKWKSWSVILTGSQLLFFKDPTWALTLLEQAQVRMDEKESQDGSGQHMLLPKMTSFKPDEVFPVKDCIAVYDSTFNSHPNTFRFVMPQNRQYLMQAPDESEMNEWITSINYASAFKTAGLKMRAGTMRKDQVILAGAAAAASHRREMRGSVEGQMRSESSARNVAGGKRAVFGESGSERKSSETENGGKKKTAEVKGVDVDGANERVNEGEQLEEVFGVVKAELAAGRGIPATKNVNVSMKATATPRLSEDGLVRESQNLNTPSAQASRVGAIYAHLNSLRKKSAPLETAIAHTLLVVRNLALLTPFQKATRDRISTALPPIAHRIQSDRLWLSKFRLWIKVLEHEAEREDREWKIMRHVALQAAARSMREDGVEGVVKDVVRDEEGGPRAVPVLALPIAEGDRDEASDGGGGGDKLGTSPGELPVIFRRSNDEPLRSDTGRPSVSQGMSGTSTSTPDFSRQSSTDFLSVVSEPGLLRNGSEDARRMSDTEYLSEPEIGSRRGSTDERGQGDGSGSDRSAEEGRSAEGEYNADGTPMIMMFPMESPMDIGVEREAILGNPINGPANEEFDPNTVEETSTAETSHEEVEDDDVEDGKQGVTHAEDREEKQEEQAEDWQSTKAAKRVSLVRPGEMSDWEKMSMRKISGASASAGASGRGK
ncbi:hypothetical protein IAR55_004442 [Kwoniella newhampshirensis]|uniref:ARF guanyl-nucleotide exchange factor n=1 Tax=Kwoniella newhampshirensis TaxID=1651941 RepID=A0AAW0YX05_9TREE